MGNLVTCSADCRGHSGYSSLKGSRDVSCSLLTFFVYKALSAMHAPMATCATCILQRPMLLEFRTCTHTMSLSNSMLLMLEIASAC